MWKDLQSIEDIGVLWGWSCCIPWTVVWVDDDRELDVLVLHDALHVSMNGYHSAAGPSRLTHRTTGSTTLHLGTDTKALVH